MDLRAYLDEMGVGYSWSHHDPAYTAQSLARREHVSGKRVVKPVLVQADGQFVLCALPAAYYIDMQKLCEALHAQNAAIADEAEMRRVFAGCELGAEPPIGNLFGLPTLMDESLAQQDQIMFQAGTHEDGVAMSMRDYMRLANPKVVQFGKPRG